MIVRNQPPKRDCNLMWQLPLILCLISFLISLCAKSFSAAVSIFSRNLLISLIIFIINRTLRFVVDLMYQMKYKKRNISIWDIISNNFYFSGESWCYIVSAFVMIAYFNSVNWEISLSTMQNSVIDVLGLAALFAFLQSRGMDEHPTKKAIEIEQSSSFLASGFFYGYLKIILPDLRRKIDNYINKHSVGEYFKVRKLLVLIPSSAVLFDDISRSNNRYIEEAGNLDEEVCNRALVTNRSYKNTVYKIKDPKSDIRYYTVFEGATPIKTFYEQCRENKTHAKYKHEMVYAFYTYLKTLLDSTPEIKDDIELVYYEDDERPGYGSEKIDLHDIILERLKYIISEQERQISRYH